MKIADIKNLRDFLNVWWVNKKSILSTLFDNVVQNGASFPVPRRSILSN